MRSEHSLRSLMLHTRECRASLFKSFWCSFLR
jgi:hypothetical protein